MTEKKPTFNKEKGPTIRIPAADVLSEAKDRPDYYKDLFIEGIDTDDLGAQRFILSQKQGDKYVRLDPKMRLSERDEDLEHYQKLFDKKKEE